MSVLSSERMKRVLQEASTRFDWVIIDTPPVALLTPMLEVSGRPSARTCRACAKLRIAQSGTAWISSAMTVLMPCLAASSICRSYSSHS